MGVSGATVSGLLGRSAPGISIGGGAGDALIAQSRRMGRARGKADGELVRAKKSKGFSNF